MPSCFRFSALSMVALTAIGAGSVLAAPAPTPDDPAAILAETKQSPNAKLGPWLDNLYQEYQEAKGKGVEDKNFRSTNKALRVTRATIGLDAVATDGAALARSLKAMGATNVRNQGPLVSARVPVSALGKLAAVPTLKYARSPLATTEAGLPPKAISQGDVSLRADFARANYGVDGTGITVGVLSDSFACNPSAFQPGAPTSTKDQDISNDELPASITILKDGSCPDGTDEGRAMAQLIHDVAPESSIAFYTAFESEFDFAEGILQLKNRRRRRDRRRCALFLRAVFFRRHGRTGRGPRRHRKHRSTVLLLRRQFGTRVIRQRLSASRCPGQRRQQPQRWCGSAAPVSRLRSGS